LFSHKKILKSDFSFLDFVEKKECFFFIRGRENFKELLHALLRTISKRLASSDEKNYYFYFSSKAKLGFQEFIVGKRVPLHFFTG